MACCKPSFKTPSFNVVVKIWRFGAPLGGPANVTTVGQLSAGSFNADALPLPSAGIPHPGGMWLKVPKSTDIQDRKNGVGPDSVEVPAGSGRYYTAVWVDDVGMGFMNEHRFACLYWNGVNWPVPFPSGPGVPPPPLILAWVSHVAFGSLGVPVLLYNSGPFVAVGPVGLVVATLNVIGGLPPVVQASAGGAFVNANYVGAVRAVAGIPYQTFRWLFPSVPGPMAIAFAFGVGPAVAVQLKVDELTGGAVNLDQNEFRNDPPVNPIITPGAPTAHAVEGLNAASWSANDIAPTAWILPYVKLSVDIADVIAGNLFTLSNAMAVVAATGVFVATPGVTVPGNWGMMSQSWW